MGNLWSTVWREDADVFTQNRKDGLIDEIKNLGITGECRTINILVFGLVGSGKSSLVNTFITASRNSGQLSSYAVSHPNNYRSTTKKLVEVELMTLSNNATVNIFDCIGFPPDMNKATTLIDDIKKTINGHIKSGYEFQNKTIQENDEYYRRNPTLSDKMHCVLFVVNGEQDLKENDSVYSPLKSLQNHLEDMNIPIRLILTKADKPSVCGVSGLSYIFWSTEAKNKVEDAKKRFALLDCQVYPIANYVSGTKQTVTQDVLALLAMNSIIQEALLYIKYENKSLIDS